MAQGEEKSEAALAAAALGKRGIPADLREPRSAGGLRGHEGQREADGEAGSRRQRERLDHGVGSERARAAHRGRDQRRHADARAVWRVRAGRREPRWRGQRGYRGGRHDCQRREFTGNVDATKLQADLGALGIELRDGRVLGEARRGGGFKLAGSVASGKGHIEFDGAMDERGVIDAKIIGQNFLAADIPAANVS